MPMRAHRSLRHCLNMHLHISVSYNALQHSPLHYVELTVRRSLALRPGLVDAAKNAGNNFLHNVYKKCNQRRQQETDRNCPPSDLTCAANRRSRANWTVCNIRRLSSWQQLFQTTCSLSSGFCDCLNERSCQGPPCHVAHMRDVALNHTNVTSIMAQCAAEGDPCKLLADRGGERCACSICCP
jgi:hypothetical protein